MNTDYDPSNLETLRYTRDQILPKTTWKIGHMEIQRVDADHVPDGPCTDSLNTPGHLILRFLDDVNGPNVELGLLLVDPNDQNHAYMIDFKLTPARIRHLQTALAEAQQFFESPAHPHRHAGHACLTPDS